jgi:hypothetical protein
MTSATAARLARNFGASALAAAALLAATGARADNSVVWFVTGTFDDGGTLSGTFTIDASDVMSSWDLTVSGGTAGFATEEYKNGTSQAGVGGATSTTADPFIAAGFGFQEQLALQFTSNLLTLSDHNALVDGANGPSFQCVQSFSCTTPSGGPTRYLLSGFASGSPTTVTGETGGGGGGSVPEPANWALLIAGFGATGAALRRRALVA